MRVLFLFALVVVGHAAEVSPVQKVIELLDNLKGKVAADLQAEENEMVEYSKYCDDESSARGYAIKSAGKAIEVLNADIEDANAQIAAMESDISALSSEAAQKETELQNALNLRKAERKDFKKTETSLVKAEDELQAAEVVIKREMAAFVQVGKGQKKSKPNWKQIAAALGKVIESSAVNSQSKAKLQGFLQAQEAAGDQDKDLQMPASEAPAVAGYEDHSGGVLTTIQDLEVKDEDQLSSTRKGEMNAQHSFDMMKMSMMDAIDLLKKKVADATHKKAALQEQAGGANGEKVATEKTKAADEAFLKGLSVDCASTAAAWEDRKKDAADEMAAIDKAKEILATGVSAAAGFVQVTSPDDVDVPTADDKEQMQRDQVRRLLKNLGQKFNSFSMVELAGAAASDPFAKVKGLIEDMIAKLLDAAAAEADHKAFCDTELGKSRKAKNDKARTMDQYRARIDDAATTKAELNEQLKELQSEVADIDKSQATATNLRNEEHSTYLTASADQKNSAEAVERAMAVLSQYYGTALVQTKTFKKNGNKQPDFGSKTGGDVANTILSILEVSASDFTKMLAATEAAEEEAAAAYSKLSDDNRVAKAAKLAEIRGKESETRSLTVALSHHNEDYKMAEKEYGAIMDYLDKLKPECETKVMSYAEKKARREQEIEGLKEALSIIEGTAVPSVDGTELIQRHKH